MAAPTVARFGGLGSRLGLVPGPMELKASLNPADYTYGTPNEAQLARLRQQQKASEPCGVVHQTSGAGSQAALQGAPPPQASTAGAAAAAQPDAHATAHAAHHHHTCPLSDDLFGGQLDLDDDCLRLLLGEDADEAAGPCASAAGSGKGPTGTGSGSGASQKSSATAGEAAAAPGGSGAAHPAAAAAAEGEAASLPAGSAAAAAAAMVAAIKEEEEEDIAMLFGEYHRGGTGGLEPLDLHLLGAAHHHPLAAVAAACEDSADNASAAGCAGDDGGDADTAAAGSPTKRAKPAAGAGALPLPHCLHLSMDYEKAAQSINLELMGTGSAVQCKATAACSEPFDAMLPLLSPVLDFAAVGGSGAPGVDTPESPDSLASGSDTVSPLPPLGMPRQDSSGKRKRPVQQ